MSDEKLLKESGKVVVFVIGLMEKLRAEKHRCLVMSSSRGMLNIIEKVMQTRARHLSLFHT